MSAGIATFSSTVSVPEGFAAVLRDVVVAALAFPRLSDATTISVVFNSTGLQIGHEVRQGALIKNGSTEAVGGIVMMIAGGNAKEIVGRIKERIDTINAQGILPDGLKVVPFYDRSELVDAALWTVTKVLLEGVVLVVVVLFLFLGDVRSSLIVVATLLLTPLLTFMAMNKLGISANLMSLGGLAIAIGELVDDAVVDVENILRRMKEKAARGEACSVRQTVIAASLEVRTAIVYATLIIALVFVPLFALPGIEGRLFVPLGVAFIVSTLASLVV